MSPAPASGSRFRVTRRGLLIGTGAAGAGLVVGAVLGRNAFYRAVAGLLADGTMPGSVDANPVAWFELRPSNTVRVCVPKVEMGQGVHTALAQIAAEELAVAWEQLEVAQGDTARGPVDALGTVGSASVSGLYGPLRLAAATMREMIAAAGASRLGVARGELDVANGHVSARGGRTLSFAEIAAAVEHWPELDAEPSLKTPDQFAFIGRPIPRLDLEAKVRGEAAYGYDRRVEGMAYGAVARPPSFDAHMMSAHSGTAPEQPGVISVVIDRERDFAGVVARTRKQARAAVAMLDIAWSEGVRSSTAEIEAMLDVSDGVGIPIQKDGDAERELETGPTLTAEYSTPFAAHAQLEPQAALATVTADRVVIDVSTQMARSAQAEVAAALKMDTDRVTIRPTYLGGGFGRKTGFEPAIEAALLARAARCPVHVGWSRTEEMQSGFLRPPTRSRLSARLEKGRITALRHNHASGEVLFGFLPPGLDLLVGADPGAWRGAYSFYNTIEHRLLSTLTVRLPVPTGSWRGLGLFSNTFATESFMDELAHAAGADPLAFRLDHLADDPVGRRMRAVLEAVARRSGYGEPTPKGHARGIACSIDVNTVVAMCVEASLGDDGTVIVHRAAQAIDAGRIVNPDGALAQAQGSILMGLSSTLLEQVEIQDGAVTAGNFDAYPLLTMSQTPEIDVEFVASDGAPSGMGEPAIGPVGAAVANALFALTRTRVRTLPLTSERIAAARG